MLRKIGMVYDTVLNHAFELDLDEYFGDIVTNPTPEDVDAFCSKIERIKSVPQISAMHLRRWRMQIEVVNKTLNGREHQPQEVTELVQAVGQILTYLKESKVIESIQDHSKKVSALGDEIVAELLKNKGNGISAKSLMTSAKEKMTSEILKGEIRIQETVVFEKLKEKIKAKLETLLEGAMLAKKAIDAVKDAANEASSGALVKEATNEASGGALVKDAANEASSGALDEFTQGMCRAREKLAALHGALEQAAAAATRTADLLDGKAVDKEGKTVDNIVTLVEQAHAATGALIRKAAAPPASTRKSEKEIENTAPADTVEDVITLEKSLKALETREVTLQESVDEIAQLFGEAASMLELDLGLSEDVAMPGLPGSKVIEGARQLGKEVVNEVKVIGDTLKEQVIDKSVLGV